MRVTVTVAGGDLIIDADSTEVAALVRELRKVPRKPKPKRLELESAEEPLSQALADTWNWLVAYDSPTGVSTGEVCDGLGIPKATASYRLRTLVEKGLAHQPSRGHWRRGDN